MFLRKQAEPGTWNDKINGGLGAQESVTRGLEQSLLCGLAEGP